NRAAHFSIRNTHTTLEVTATATIDTSARPDDLGPASQQAWEEVTVDATTPLDVLEFSLDSALVSRSAELADYAAPSFTPGRQVGAAVTELCHRINRDFVFDPKATDVDTPLDEVMRTRRGVCQDFAHVMVGCLRSMGLAARYVSGYLETTPPPGRPRLVGADRTHAWVGLHLGHGVWIGLDPTNDQVAGRHYLTTAHGRDYSDIPPLKGVIFTDAETSTLSVSVDVVAR
ncbi:MAG: transglutaminase family protein, partial [Actinomycetota bacterium]